MTNQAHDNPNVIIFPPMLLPATIIAGIVLDWLIPIGLLDVVPRWPRMIVGGILFVLGVSMPISARRAFREAETNIRPDEPTTAIITPANEGH